MAGKFALFYKCKKVNTQTKIVTFIFTTKDVSLFFSPINSLHLLPRVTKGLFEKLLFGAGTPGIKTWTWPSAAGTAHHYCDFPPFALGQHRKSKGASEATFEPYVFASSPCEQAQMTLFSSFICMLGANLAMDLKTNHSYWFCCEFAT